MTRGRCLSTRNQPSAQASRKNWLGVFSRCLGVQTTVLVALHHHCLTERRLTRGVGGGGHCPCSGALADLRREHLLRCWLLGVANSRLDMGAFILRVRVSVDLEPHGNRALVTNLCSLGACSKRIHSALRLRPPWIETILKGERCDVSKRANSWCCARRSAHFG